MGKNTGLRAAVNKIRAGTEPTIKPYEFPIQRPQLPPGVAPEGVTPPVIATDSATSAAYTFAAAQFPGGGFPGFSYLSNLATRAEFRAFAASMSTEITREWIEFTSKQDDDTDSADKIKAIEAEFKRLGVRQAVQKAAEHDCLFGRGQLFVGVRGAERNLPLILSPATVPQGSLESVVPVEAVWTTPAAYNALDPVAPDFYRPSSWFMLGREVHASRLLTIITRPLPDILKPAFNFAGMSLSQLAEPYVNNWLRTRQSVADLINNFSITVLSTSMEQILQGDDDGADLLARADLFNATRSNKGLMLLDKDREELTQVNAPLSGLHELQAQSQEHMCSVSRMPAIILTGISPSGLNASSDGEIRVFYDWIAAQQEAYWREPLETILKVVQLSLFGEIDQDIGFEFRPLYQMTPKELAEIREAESRTASAYVTLGALDPSEVRDKLAKDPESGFAGIDVDAVLVGPDDTPPPAMDADKWITVHPNGPDSKGTPALIGENGEVKGGMGGKFNGKHIKDAHGTQKFTGGETNAETAARHAAPKALPEGHERPHSVGFSGMAAAMRAATQAAHEDYGTEAPSPNDDFTIKHETDKAYAIANPGYDPQPSGYYGRHRAAKGEHFDNQKYIWLPKNHVTVEGEGENRRIASLSKWIAGEKGINTHEFLARQAETDKTQAHIESVANKRYDDLIAHAKANGIKGVRSGMRTSTILDKYRDAGIEPPATHGGQVGVTPQEEAPKAAKLWAIPGRGKGYLLNVPFSEKDNAKAEGARWSPDLKKWYFPEGSELPEGLKKWAMDVQMAMDSAIEYSEYQLEILFVENA